MLVAFLAVLLTGCEASQALPAPSSAPQLPAPAPARYAGTPGPVFFGSAPLVTSPRTTTARRLTPARYLPLGSLWVDPLTQRVEPVLGDLSRTAVLIGDSQSVPQDSWVRGGLRGAGYSVYFAGAGGTGYSVGTRRTHAYVEALRRGDWRLPAGTPRLVVVEGGGNDASRGSGNAAIASGARSLVAELRRTYPGSRIVMVGTLARAAADGGGRRNRVDTLLRRTADGLGVPFISCGDWISRYHLKDQLADRVHLKPAGRARLAPVLAAALEARGLGIAVHPRAGRTGPSSASQWPHEVRSTPELMGQRPGTGAACDGSRSAIAARLHPWDFAASAEVTRASGSVQACRGDPRLAGGSMRTSSAAGSTKPLRLSSPVSASWAAR